MSLKNLSSLAPWLGNHLLATTHLATDTITSSVNNEYSFFGNANLINAPDLANMRVAILPLAIPLPYGHGINRISIFDGKGMMKLVEQLTNIDPCYGIWLTAMHLSLQYLEGLSLHHQSLNIHPKYFKPLEDPDQLRMEIPILLIPLIPPQGSAPQLIDAFTKVQESNMEKWLKLNENKSLYDNIMKKLALFFNGAPTPAGTLPSGHAPQVHVVTPTSHSDQQTKIKVKKALAFAKLLLGDTDEGSNTFILAELSPSFVSLVETGVSSTSTSGLRDFQLYVGDHAKNHRGNTQSVIEHKRTYLLVSSTHHMSLHS
jgi:hypothetical protein